MSDNDRAWNPAIRLIAWDVTVDGVKRTAFVGMAIGDAAALIDLPDRRRYVVESTGRQAVAIAEAIAESPRARLLGDEGADANRPMTDHLAEPRTKR